MASAMKSTVQTYEIGYKGYHHEMSEWYSQVIKAKDEREALKRFARQRHVKPPDQDIENWHWEENDWLMAFRYIKKVELQTCPHCRGAGTLRIAKNDS